MSKFLAFLQQLVNADKTPIAVGAVALLGVLFAKFGFHMNGSAVAYLSAAVIGVESVFVHAHFARQSAPVPGEHQKP